MPTIASSVVPPPKAWDEFEDITLAAARLRWVSTDFQRNGRTGQKQDGVDVFGHDDADRLIGVQCKNTVGGIGLVVIKKEIVNAEAFEPRLDRLFIATTAMRDAPLQKAVRLLSEKRREAGQFRVAILFWEDVCQDLAKDDGVFFAHYPQFRAKQNDAHVHDKALFDELTSLLKSDGVIGFLDQNNMAGFSFVQSRFDPLWDYLHTWNTPEREFITPELDGIRKALWEKIDAYTDLLTTETFDTRNHGRKWVPPEWEYEQPERFWRVVKAFHQLAGEIVALHAELVRMGKAQLIGSAR